MSIHRFDFTAPPKPRALPASLGALLEAEAVRWGSSPREAMREAHRARRGRMAGARPIPVLVVVEAVLAPPPPVAVAPLPPLVPGSWSKSMIRRIQRATADEFGVTVADIISHRRTMGTRIGAPDVITPRFVATYLARELTLLPWPSIGRMFGGRDHSTIYYAIRVMVDRLASEPALSARVRAIREKIEAGR